MGNPSAYTKSFPPLPLCALLPSHVQETSEHSLFLYNRALASVSPPSSLPDPLAWGCLLCPYGPHLTAVLATGERRGQAPPEGLQLPCPGFHLKSHAQALTSFGHTPRPCPFLAIPPGHLPSHAPSSPAFPWTSAWASSCFP